MCCRLLQHGLFDSEEAEEILRELVDSKQLKCAPVLHTSCTRQSTFSIRWPVWPQTGQPARMSGAVGKLPAESAQPQLEVPHAPAGLGRTPDKPGAAKRKGGDSDHSRCVLRVLSHAPHTQPAEQVLRQARYGQDELCKMKTARSQLRARHSPAWLCRTPGKPRGNVALASMLCVSCTLSAMLLTGSQLRRTPGKPGAAKRKRGDDDTPKPRKKRASKADAEDDEPTPKAKPRAKPAAKAAKEGAEAGSKPKAAKKAAPRKRTPGVHLCCAQASDRKYKPDLSLEAESAGSKPRCPRLQACLLLAHTPG